MAVNANFGYTADISTINSWADIVNRQGEGMVNPSYFYSKQLLDTIQIPPEEFVYYKLAKEQPIGDKADKLVLRRYAPLEAHTVPLMEGIPPTSDKVSLEKYEIQANQYGRYMEFTDKVSWKIIDPVLTLYTNQYSYVAVQTLDMLAREALFAIAQRFYAGQAANFEALTVDSVPTIQDLRLIVLGLERALVKPDGSTYKVIASPEFYFDMLEDPIVQNYMRFNRTTSPMYGDAATPLPDMFKLSFQQTLVAPVGSDFVSGGVPAKRMFRIVGLDADGNNVYDYLTWLETEQNANNTGTMVSVVNGYVQDKRTGQDASYIPQQKIWDVDRFSTKHLADAAVNTPATAITNQPWYEFKVAHTLVVGADALIRTGLQGEGNAKMFVKPLGSTGVLDPIDQRQSLGFKINSVGFGSSRLEAVVDYISVPREVNVI